MYKAVQKATKSSPYGAGRFLPKDEISKLGASEIREALCVSRKGPMGMEIHGDYSRIFATLCLMKRPTKIRIFLEKQVQDTDLPLQEATVAGHNDKLRLLRSRRDDAIGCKQFLKEDDISAFLELQWIVLAPSFVGYDGATMPHKILRSNEVLPFLSSPKIIREGGFGQVSRIEIHPNHHSLAVSKPFIVMSNPANVA
jgi:hypothetical protein